VQQKKTRRLCRVFDVLKIGFLWQFIPPLVAVLSLGLSAITASVLIKSDATEAALPRRHPGC
jgi:hypothetical protein